MGFDANSAPDARTLETLRKFLGAKFMPNTAAETTNRHPNTVALPASVSSISTHNSLNDAKLEFPNTADSRRKAKLPLLMPFTEVSEPLSNEEKIFAAKANESLSSGFKGLQPIQPVNVGFFVVKLNQICIHNLYKGVIVKTFKLCGKVFLK